MIIRFVYIVGVTTNPVKIGISDNPEKRIQALQIGCPDQLTLHWSAMLPNGSAANLESAVHRELADHHRRGEWFDIDLEIAIATVQRLAPGVVDKDTMTARERYDRFGDEVDYLVSTDAVQPTAPATVHWYRTLQDGRQRLRQRVDALIVKEAGATAVAALRTFVLERKGISSVFRRDPAAARRARQVLAKAIEVLRRAEAQVKREEQDARMRSLLSAIDKAA